MRGTPPTALKHPIFTWAIVLICVAYFAFEYFYVNYAAFVVDEFTFARQIYEYTLALPYRDFIPYKGVIGNYLLSPALIFSRDLFTPLFQIKVQIAAMNTLCIAISVYWARRFFADYAILIALMAILVNHQFLLLSSDLRVDMLASWICLFSCLALIGNQIRLGGTLIGIAFLVSQKAIWYLIAINGAFGCCWLLLPNTQYNLRHLIRFNFHAASVLAIYVVFWSIIATPGAVYQSLFYEGYLQAGIDWYTRIYLACWQIALMHGPVLFMLWPLTFAPLFSHANSKATEQHVFIIVLSSLALLQFIFYKQPFPYNFVFVAPAFFLLYSNLFNWLIENNKRHKALLTIMLVGGIVYPLCYSLIATHHYNKNYQQSMLQLAAELTKDGSDYVAGMPLFYGKDQPIDGMKNLIGPQIDYLYQPSEKIGKILLESLYLSKTTSKDVINQLELQPVKVIINNQRIEALPPSILNYLHENFAPYSGSIDIYAPTIKPRQMTFYLKFSGDYRIQATKSVSVKIDKHVLHTGNIIHLTRGDHLSSTRAAYRLVLAPKVKENQILKKDEFIKAVIY